MCWSSVLLLTVAFCTVVLGTPVTQTEMNLKIIGGEEATDHEFPYQVGIATRRAPEKPGWCGGALISSKFVLTAAHCLKGIYEATVFIGTHDVQNFSLNPNAVSLVVGRENMFVHSRWSPRYVVNDIALIRLPEAVQQSESIQTVDLPPADFNVTPGELLVATGWGRTTRNMTIPRPAKLHFVKLKVEADDICKKVFFYYNSTLNICLAGEPKMTICRGDSGGPIVSTERESGRRVLVGITSYGRKCENVSVLTKVAAFLDWISEKVFEVE